MTLDHIGIAAASPAADALFQRLLGIAPYKTETVDREGVRTVFFGDGKAGRAPKLELLHALHDASPVAGFLTKRGPGLHHLAFEVDDLEAEMARVAADGFRLLADAPKPGADGKRIVFLHPKDTGGVLVELVQSTRQREWQRVASADGEIAVQVSGPEEAPPLVVLHGALGSTEMETDRLIRFWERDFRVYGVDFLGHGRSGDLPAGTPTWGDWTAQVVAAMDGLDIERAHLFGFSMGGGVALAVAHDHPDRVDRLAVHGVNVRWTEDEVERMVTPIDPDRMAREQPFWARRLAEVHGGARWRDLVGSVVAFTRALPTVAVDDAWLRQVTTPTLVSHGDADRFFDLRHPFHLRRTLSDARLRIVPALDHPIQGVRPARFAADVSAFLR